MRCIRSRFARPSFIPVSRSDIGNTLPLAQMTRASRTPRRSTASNTAGRSFEAGVGRNWLSMMIASEVSGPSSSEKRGPPAGRSSAAAAAAVTSGRAGGSFGFSHAQRFRLGMSRKSRSR